MNSTKYHIIKTIEYPFFSHGQNLYLDMNKGINLTVFFVAVNEWG